MNPVSKEELSMPAKYVRDMRRSEKRSMMQEDQQCGTNSVRSEHKHMEDLLDEGLEQTFPASDPVAVYFEACTRLRAATSSDRSRGARKSTIGRVI
jgi:hypothetical protein